MSDKLDPYFGQATGDELIFELRASVIAMEADAIVRSADYLWFRAAPSLVPTRKQLAKSAQALRDAAGRLDALTGKQPIAAE